MAHTNKPFGFRPVRMKNGSPWTGEANTYVVLHGNNETLRIGDLVKLSGSADANGVPTVNRASVSGTAAAGTAFLGAIVGIAPVGPYSPVSLVGTSLSLENKSILVTDAVDKYVFVCDSRDVIYEVQSDATGLSRDQVGLNATFDAVVTADVDGLSEFALDGSGTTAAPAVTATLQFRIVGLSPKGNNLLENTAVGTLVPFVVALVQPNEHAFGAGAAGI